MDETSIDNLNLQVPTEEKKENEEHYNNEQVKPEDNSKEKKRTREERTRRGDKKSIERGLKALNDAQSMEEKLDIVCKKYSELFDENRKNQIAIKQAEKKIAVFQREKDQYQSERSKAILTRKRLENLCRELQKQNKAVKEESLLKIREEEEKRKEVSAKFQNTLAEITALMNQNIEKNTKMQEDNIEMNKKFKSVYEQVELKEQQLRTVHQQMRLDVQLAHTKLAKVKMEATAEKETLLKDKHQLLFKLTEYEKQIRELQATEINLRSQLDMYTDKYDEFQNALTRSNKVYGEFNEEMVKMSKKIMTLEKETSLWKQRWGNTHIALLEMAADKQIKESEIVTLNKKLSLLQDLCKMFQRERTSLFAQLKEKNGTNESQGQNDDQFSNQNPLNQVDTLTEDCLKLENNFGQLQNSLVQIYISLPTTANSETVLTEGQKNDQSQICEGTETSNVVNVVPNEENQPIHIDGKETNIETTPQSTEDNEESKLIIKETNEPIENKIDGALEKQVDLDVLSVIKNIAELVEKDIKKQTMMSVNDTETIAKNEESLKIDDPLSSSEQSSSISNEKTETKSPNPTPLKHGRKKKK